MNNGSERTHMPTKFDVARGVAMINNNLGDLGFIPRDADGNDYANGLIPSLRFKTGTSMGEVTTQVLINNKAQQPIRATSWSGLDRMILAIRGYVDQPHREVKA